MKLKTIALALAMLYSASAVAMADDAAPPTLTVEEGEALYEYGVAQASAQAQLKPFQDAAKSAIAKLNASQPKPSAAPMAKSAPEPGPGAK